MRKILTLTTTFIIILAMLLSLPVASAIPKNATPFEQHIQLSPEGGSPGVQVSEGGIMYVTGAISTGTAIATSTPVSSGNYWIKISGFFDSESSTGAFYGKWRITSSNDGFSGVMMGESKATNDPSIFEVSGTLIGFGGGIYEGDRIKGSFSGNVNYGAFTLDLVISGTFYDKR